ncbi:MAG: methylmalonyl Co-A mutase-associated GTPase MeaB [Deltaproteobacteria bacterium CG12_big_fil_rev_8_21_14_0_65_43_10]|nr:MAG: methylmalonyl Co-A mutase-associated GTPase MeaB [Deltaproteobacteria bacterium CG12_big_fil_rev_8_21_14_0_65_43_10]PIZ18977.1 MAG: methylmalonyl Co-A mutase-associated GTPase MeaB [Deltaproteobacteria bacterium CG_4_10_14_0_8_um_filter_43_12]HCX90381.1 methylmalonyl Co-A mutase-associated GTPase MeaB [Deltaproteobacteria bacterium]
MELVDEVRKGSVRALAKLITLVENEMPGGVEAMEEIYPLTGNAYIIGITGPPGAGKSTLTDRITKELRRKNCTVGIIAIDPTSPFTGGALLGDRVRMQGVSSDEDVFIRSMATRGSLGGLSRATSDTVKILDAYGKDYVIIETVGVGQDEVDIVRTADISILVVMPGGGDDIQAIKAGIMEIGDIFVVNKADRDGADRLVTEIKMMLGLSSVEREWTSPIIKTIATEDQGIGTLVEKINEHREFLVKSGMLACRRKERIRSEIIKMIEYEIYRYLDSLIAENKDFFEQRLEDIVNKKEDPYLLAKKTVETIAKRISKNANV